MRIPDPSSGPVWVIVRSAPFLRVRASFSLPACAQGGKTYRCLTRPDPMGEGRVFVNTALLEEELHRGLRAVRTRSSSLQRRASARTWVLTFTLESEARQGFLPAAVQRDTCAGRLQFPTEVRVRPGRSSAAWSCLRRVPSPGPSMERSGAASSAQSHIDDPSWGHADTRAVCWLRPSWLSLPRPTRGNGSRRRAGRRTPGGALVVPRRRGRCCDPAAQRCGGSRI